MRDDGPPSAAPAAKSGFFYRTVTRYWPRIAVLLVALAAIAEWVVGGITSSGALEFYVFAWATATGALWWLFDRAEATASQEARERIASWVTTTDVGAGLRALPEHYVRFFDRVFGERHLSVKCLARSAVASLLAVIIVATFWASVTFPYAAECQARPVPPEAERAAAGRIEAYWYSWRCEFLTQERAPSMEGPVLFWLGRDPADDRERVILGVHRIDLWEAFGEGATILVLAVLLNLIPDFLSLWETRVVLRWMARRRRLGRALLLDALLTTLISLSVMWLGLRVAWANPVPQRPEPGIPAAAQMVQGMLTLKHRVGAIHIPSVPTVFDPSGELELEPWQMREGLFFPIDRTVRDDYVTHYGFPPGIFFYSAFATSVWLWLFVLAWLASRLLLRLGRGTGFLLEITDVQHRPFRSLGFVTVIVVSGIFLLGLPFVVLG